MTTYKLVKKSSKITESYSYKEDLKILKSLYKETKLHKSKRNKLIFENAVNEFTKRYGPLPLEELRGLGGAVRSTISRGLSRIGLGDDYATKDMDKNISFDTDVTRRNISPEDAYKLGPQMAVAYEYLLTNGLISPEKLKKQMLHHYKGSISAFRHFKKDVLAASTPADLAKIIGNQTHAMNLAMGGMITNKMLLKGTTPMDIALDHIHATGNTLANKWEAGDNSVVKQIQDLVALDKKLNYKASGSEKHTNKFFKFLNKARDLKDVVAGVPHVVARGVEKGVAQATGARSKKLGWDAAKNIAANASKNKKGPQPQSAGYSKLVSKNKQLREAVFGMGDPFLSFITSHIKNFHNLDVSTIIGSICGYAKSAEAQMATSGLFGKILHGLATVLLKGVAIVGTWIASCIDFIMGTMNVPIYNAYPTFTFGKAFILAALCASVLWVLKKVMGKFNNKNVKEASYLYIEVQNAIAECNVTFDKMKELGESIRLEEREKMYSLDTPEGQERWRQMYKDVKNQAPTPVTGAGTDITPPNTSNSEQTPDSQPKALVPLNAIIKRAESVAAEFADSDNSSGNKASDSNAVDAKIVDNEDDAKSPLKGAAKICSSFVLGWSKLWSKMFGKDKSSVRSKVKTYSKSAYSISKTKLMSGFKNFKEIISMVAYNVTAPIRKKVADYKLSKRGVKDKDNVLKRYNAQVDNRVASNKDVLRNAKKHPWLARLSNMMGPKGAKQAAAEVAYLVNKMTKKGLNLTEAEKINVAAILVENKYKKILAKKYGMSLSE